MRQQAGELQPVATGLALPFGQMGIQQQRLELIVLQAVQLEGLAVFDGRLLQLEPHLEAAVEEVPGGLAIEAQQLRQLQPPAPCPTPRAGADRRSGSWRPPLRAQGRQPVGGIGEETGAGFGVKVGRAVGGEGMRHDQVFEQPLARGVVVEIFIPASTKPWRT